ncbi:chromosome segregation protein SMC [Tindallia californiensis]|uniref:Chromosome partition protein Smc n=1 Tax=Tindallia californiensis TaxID=159292 RepID=A0A1H3NTB4_9FIRM|nr:chromosome segregation protein SMC [Tindallia californiensis]SDY92156.1 condensin subunit Smc [Tindallia californiensis]
MYLKRLEIKGFKSFAHKVDIQFEKGITGIVGPNGCGKSNITEAMRWVLGEQSAKSLRGHKMEDVIFTGTDKRRAMGIAEVSIVFDNATRKLPLAFEEVCLTRRVYRSGESEYFINNSSCRRKELKELLMDTGIGKEGYSMISQGRIDEIINQKGEERRLLIDEAAGIVKYRSRKDEAEKKIQRTHEHLLRINDILSELNQHIKPLELQASQAEKYLRMKELADYLEISTLVDNIDKQSNAMQEIKQKIHQAESKARSCKKTENNIQEKLEGKELALESYRQKTNALQSELEKIKKTIEENRIQRNIYYQQINYRKSHLLKLDKEIIEQNLNLMDTKTRLDQLNILLQDLNKSILDVDGKLEKFYNEIKLKKESLAMYKDKVETGKSSIIENHNELNSIHNKHQRTSALQEANHLRLRVVEDDIKKIRKEEEMQRDLEKRNSEKKTTIESNISQLRVLADNQKKRLHELENKHESELIDVQKIVENIQKLNNKKSLLVKMSKNYDGFNVGVKNLLTAVHKESVMFDGFRGIVADLLTVSSGYELAIEIAMGQALQFLITDHDYQAKKIIDYLKKTRKGRVTILPISSVQERKLKQEEKYNLQKFDKSFCALDLVSFSSHYETIFNYLLGRVIVTDDLEVGIQISRKFNQQVKITTIDGELILPGGSMTGGSYSKQNDGLLIRKKEIKEIENQIVILQEKEKKRRVGIEENEAKIKAVKDKIAETEREISNEEKKLIEVSINASNFVDRINDLKNNHTRLEDERYELKRNLFGLDVREKTFLLDIAVLNQRTEKVQGEVEDNLIILDKHKVMLESIQNKHTDLRIEAAELKERKQSLEKEKQDLENAIIHSTVSSDTLRNERINSMASMGELSNKLYLQEKKIDHFSAKELQQEKQIMRFSTLEDQTRLEYQNAMNELDTTRNKQDEMKNEVNTLRMKSSRLEWQIEQCVEKLSLFNMDSLEAARETLNHPPCDKVVEYDLEKLKSEMKALGEINVGAIEEYRRMKDRHRFLTFQKEDMENAKESLEKIICELDYKMTKQFEEQFEKIQSSFQQVFEKLFNGGTAELHLQEPENVLYSGIDIVAQPPGKRFQHLSLLSGGEKAMTAISLLFSILLVKPSPFCVLDEIEAALDDANVDKFADFLVDLSADIQFVVVTHKKLTMERASSLYGVTMEEKGISKLLRLKLADLNNDIVS